MTRTLTFVYLSLMVTVITLSSGDAFGVLPEAISFLGGCAIGLISTWAFMKQDQKLEDLPAPPLPTRVVNSAQKILVCVPISWTDEETAKWAKPDEDWVVERLVNSPVRMPCCCPGPRGIGFQHLFLVKKP